MRRLVWNACLSFVLLAPMPVQAQASLAKERVWLNIYSKHALQTSSMETLKQALVKQGLVEPIAATPGQDPLCEIQDHGCARRQMHKVKARYALVAEAKFTEYEQALFIGYVLDQEETGLSGRPFSFDTSTGQIHDSVSRNCVSVLTQFLQARASQPKAPVRAPASWGRSRVPTLMAGALIGLSLASLATGITLMVLDGRQTANLCSNLWQAVQLGDAPAFMDSPKPCVHQTRVESIAGFVSATALGAGAGLILKFR